MVAAMATIVGPAPGMSEIARMSGEAIEGWLKDFDGYRGLVVLTDEDGERARVITLWDTHEDEQRARTARGAMRDQLAAQVGTTVESFEVYEVPVCDVVRDGDTDG
jgi:heme-degrading monooxygenase HmoA